MNNLRLNKKNGKRNIVAIKGKDKSISEMIPAHLLWLKQHVYEPSGLLIQNIKFEDESADYQGVDFSVDNMRIKFRAGKITPIKVGQFTTFWKRVGTGPISPYHFNDPFDLLIVSVCAENHFGHFVFPKKVLCEKGIVSTDDKEGKRAMRIYPPWDKTHNSHARKTQSWQLRWFIEFPKNGCQEFKFFSHEQLKY